MPAPPTHGTFLLRTNYSASSPLHASVGQIQAESVPPRALVLQEAPEQNVWLQSDRALPPLFALLALLATTAMTIFAAGITTRIRNSEHVRRSVCGGRIANCIGFIVHPKSIVWTSKQVAIAPRAKTVRFTSLALRQSRRLWAIPVRIAIHRRGEVMKAVARRSR